MSKPFIVLQTDFSLSTGYVAAMYGVIKLVDRSLGVFDLNHNVRQYDVRQASELLRATIPYWPAATVFVSVVDPGVGTKRRSAVALLKNGSYVVTPDNGSLTALIEDIDEVREIDESTNRLPGSEHKNTFHGRDVYAYCAAKLASGQISYEEVGPQYAVSDCVLYEFKRATLSQGRAEGCILDASEHFGNVSFNITVAEFMSIGIKEGDRVRLRIRREEEIIFDETVLYHRSFGFVDIGEPILFNGSTSEYLGFGLNQRSFVAKYLQDISEKGHSACEYKVLIEK